MLTVKLEGEQRKLYAAHEQRLRATLTKTKDADFNTKKIRILAEFTLLREICRDPRLVYADAKNASAKLDAICELVSTCMDESKKVLVFSQFTSFLDLIGTRLAQQGVDFYTITGETPKKRRVELVDEFNGNDVPVFLISLKAGNTGLNLVGASVVVHAYRGGTRPRRTRPPLCAPHRQTQDVNVYQIVAKTPSRNASSNCRRRKWSLPNSSPTAPHLEASAHQQRRLARPAGITINVPAACLNAHDTKATGKAHTAATHHEATFMP